MEAPGVDTEVVDNIPRPADHIDVSEFKFSKFSTTYFQYNSSHSYIRHALKHPLLSLQNEGDQMVRKVLCLWAKICYVLYPDHESCWSILVFPTLTSAQMFSYKHIVSNVNGRVINWYLRFHYHICELRFTTLSKLYFQAFAIWFEYCQTICFTSHIPEY